MAFNNDVEKVIKILNSSHSKSDSENLASLLLVTKLLKSSELSKNDLLNVFQSINLSFLIKLLKNRSVTSEDSSIYYKSIGLSILRSFSTIPFENNLITNEVLPILIEIIKSSFNRNVCDIKITENSPIHKQENIFKSEEMPNDDNVNDVAINDDGQLIYDALTIIRLIIKTESGKEIVLTSEMPSVLSALISNSICDSDEALGTFLLMLSTDNHDVLIQKYCLILVGNLAVRLSDKKEEQLIKVLETLISIFENSYCKKVLHSLESESFWTIILESIYNIITSKIDIIYCQKALLLSSCIINLFGFIWPLLKNHESLVLILLHLASIEIRMMLDELHEIQLKDSLMFLEGLTTLFIEAIKFVEECKSIKIILSQSKLSINTIQELIFDCIFTVVHFIKNCNINNLDLGCELINPCLCLLSAYISFKEFALDEDIVDLVPILVNACGKNFDAPSTIRSIEEMASDLEEIQHIDSKSIDSVDKPSLLHVFLPGFEHLSHLEEVRRVFIEKQFVQVLIDHMKKCSYGCYKDDVNTVADILYNFVMANQLSDSLAILNFLTENFSNYSENCNVLILLFAILSQSANYVQQLDVQKYVFAGIYFLKNTNCDKELRMDLIKNMAKCFSIFPEFSNYISETDYKNIFLINCDP